MYFIFVTLIKMAKNGHKKTKYIVGWMQWADCRCYKVENPDTTCEDPYELIAKSGNDTVTVRDDENIEDLLIVKCISADVRSVIEGFQSLDKRNIKHFSPQGMLVSLAAPVLPKLAMGNAYQEEGPQL